VVFGGQRGGQNWWFFVVRVIVSSVGLVAKSGWSGDQTIDQVVIGGGWNGDGDGSFSLKELHHSSF
jgi:hypothetical protein